MQISYHRSSNSNKLSLVAAIILLFLALSSTVFSQSELEKQLFLLEDVIFTPLKTPQGYNAAYKLMIRQPLDHSHPEKGYFYQKVYLSHLDFDAPTVIVTNGYNKNRNNTTEVASLLNANQLQVEHRYFGESVPDSMDYTFLNFKQITADLHRIRTLLGRIYLGDWISTGISKGGTTTIFYKYFYPDDVTVSIPYVAPLNHEFEEKRIYEFLHHIGSKKCRDDLLKVQKYLLKNSGTILPYLEWYAKGKGLTFDYLSLGEAYEYAILELPFSFWQYGHDCEKIPVGKSMMEQVNYLLDVVGLAFFSDRDIEAFGSHYYQAATEMGYYGYETENFEGMLKYLPYSPHPHAAFVPHKMKVKWDGTLTNKVAKWIENHGDHMIYINGGIDTWSATAVPKSGKVDALWFFLPGKHHGSARIKNMTDKEFMTLKKSLSKWLGINIK